MLHCSSDIVGSLRHSQLRAAGAPTLETNLASDFRMKLGTLAHEWFESVTRGLPCMTEVKMDAGLPEGWSGTADLLLWRPEYESFQLVDLKTVKPEGVQWIARDSIKHEHHAQASAYWMAAARMGLPMWHEYAILYLPTGQLPPNKPQVEPLLLPGTPDPRVFPVMEERWRQTREYLQTIDYEWNGEPKYLLTDKLAPVQDRVQKLMREDKYGNRDVILVPHWSAAFCPFDDALCNCNQAGTTKIGSWSFYGNDHQEDEWQYTPRKGYESIPVEVTPA